MPSAHSSSQTQTPKRSDMLFAVVASVATAVVASMDQATRGPSITGWVLTNAPSLLNNAPTLFC